MSLSLNDALSSSSIVMSNSVAQSFSQHIFTLVLYTNSAIMGGESEATVKNKFAGIETLAANTWKATNGEEGCNCESAESICGNKPSFCGMMDFYVGILNNRCQSKFMGKTCGELTSTRTIESEPLSFVGTQDPETLQDHINTIHYEACLNILALQTLKLEQALPAHVPSMLHGVEIPSAGLSVGEIEMMNLDADFVKLHGGSHLMMRFLNCIIDLDYATGHEHVHI